jgi:alpha-N-arabinofuranosidase
MTPEFYAHLYCQYHTHIKNYAETSMMKIASGYGGSDTEGADVAILLKTIMERRFPVQTDGISIHYYIYLPNDPRHSATQFGEEEWFIVLNLAHRMRQVIQKNADVLDTYDPEKRIWLIVDEWGAWYPVEPGTNPAFLYQQNSMRDALVAALTLHIFQERCDRVQMANLAQTVNVLQALFLTQGEQLVLTPTYHVFDLFKGHQDAAQIPLKIDCDSYTMGGDSLPVVSAGASRATNGDVLLTLCNLHPTDAQTIVCDLQDLKFTNMSGMLLVGDSITAHNTFTEPNRVQPTQFDGASFVDEQHLSVRLPAASIVALTLTA